MRDKFFGSVYVVGATILVLALALSVWAWRARARLLTREAAAETETRDVNQALARRDGALGMTRLVIDTFGKNWKAIVALAGAILAASGNVHVSLGV